MFGSTSCQYQRLFMIEPHLIKHTNQPMVLYRYQEEEIEWRSPQDALTLDLSLLEDVFRRLARQRHACGLRVSLSNNEQAHLNDPEPSSFIEPSAPPPAPVPTSGSCFHAEMLFSKSDVLMTLETSQGFLAKRKMLRMLHTSLACVSLEKESASVQGFVRFRVKERTLSFAMARAKLLQIFTKTQRAIEFQAQVQEFTRQARAKSLWCVRDSKSICQRPSQFYKVHVLPVKYKTQKQLDAEQRVLEAIAAAMVSNAIQLGLDTMVSQLACPVTGGGRSARGRTPQSAQTGEETGPGLSRSTRRGPSKLALRAKVKREAVEMEARRRQLRLEIFLASENVRALSPVSSPSRQASRQHVLSKAAEGHEGDDDLADEEQIDSQLSGGLTELQSEKKPTRGRHLLLLLATVEANGDVRIAEHLVAQRITNSGFQRALDQAKNLGLARDDHWGLVKTWKTVYRSHTLQSLQAAMSK